MQFDFFIGFYLLIIINTRRCKALPVLANDDIDNTCIQQLMATQQTLNLTSERLRNQENDNEILKTENERTNYFIGQGKLHQRELQSELAQTKNELRRTSAFLNGTQLDTINCTDSTDDDESVYNGEKWNKSSRAVLYSHIHDQLDLFLIFTDWDKRDSVPSPRASRWIFLLRHGHYEFSEPEDQIRMSALGRSQMEALGRHLASLPYNWTRAFLHSSKIRTQDAAQLVAKHLPGVELMPSELLWSVGKVINIQNQSVLTTTNWDFLQNDTIRRRTAFDTFIHRADANSTVTTYELMMLHKSVIYYFLDRALQVPAESLQVTLPHGSITLLEVESDGRVFVRELGNADFMPPELATSTNSKWI